MDKCLEAVRTSKKTRLTDLIPPQYRYNGSGVTSRRSKKHTTQIDDIMMTKGTRLLNAVGEQIKSGGNIRRPRETELLTTSQFTSSFLPASTRSTINVGFLDNFMAASHDRNSSMLITHGASDRSPPDSLFHTLSKASHDRVHVHSRDLIVSPK